MDEDIRQKVYEKGQLGKLSNEELYRLIKKEFLQKEENRRLPLSRQVEKIDRLFSTFRGYGILDLLLEDETVSEIMVNRFDEIYIEQQGCLKKTALSFQSPEEMEQMIQRIVGLSGREVNQAHPIADTRLPGGERVNVVLPPIAADGPVITIRRFPKERIAMEKLIAWNSVTEEAALFLETLVRCKYNLFISGGTGSGKTTFLNALSEVIPTEERIITIEDSAELQLQGLPNLVRLETRNANASGAGRISAQELIRTSLRMRPDRIIVGEVRGPEALDMLNAMNTGHDGSLSTGHANSSYDMLGRLETMILQGNAGLPLLAIRQKIAASIDIIVHLSKIGRERKVMEICEMAGLKGENYQLSTLFLL
ncbi:MAG TPA: CpaF family protein, partial [Clostridiales bacterium]|nr:CpaF family protein [Clostridiales bacterium]